MPLFELATAILKSCSYAYRGIVFAMRSQRNFRIHLVVGAIVLCAAPALKLHRLEIALLVLTVTGVIAAELFNSAVELVLNLLQSRDHPVVRAAKDIAAGSTLAAVLGSVVVGLLIFGPRLCALMKGGFSR